MTPIEEEVERKIVAGQKLLWAGELTPLDIAYLASRAACWMLTGGLKVRVNIAEQARLLTPIEQDVQSKIDAARTELWQSMQMSIGSREQAVATGSAFWMLTDAKDYWLRRIAEEAL